MNPTYATGPSDIQNGSATLSLIANGASVCPAVSDDMTIYIQPLPQSHAGDDEDICKGSVFVTNGHLENGGSILWSSLGSGSFDDPTRLITNYHPSEEDYDLTTVDLVLKVNAIDPCSDAALDTMKISFVSPPEVFAGNDTTICSSEFTVQNASVLNSTQFKWTSDGSGTWLNSIDDVPSPTYIPSDSDISSGSVKLTLTSTNPTCPPVSDHLTLYLTPSPVAEAGSDYTICENETKVLNTSSAMYYSQLEWSTTGGGHFNDAHILQPTYYPGGNDTELGVVKLFFTVTGNAPCTVPDVDSLTLNIQKNPVVFAGSDTIIGEGDEYKAINAKTNDTEQINWSTLGDGTFINISDPICTYTPGSADINIGSVKLIITGTSINPCNKVSRDTILVFITPKPNAFAGPDLNICEGSDILITSASAEEYSEIWWTSNGTGTLENASTLTPTYAPTDDDIINRKVTLTLNAKGKKPIEHYVVKDSMVVNIIHNAHTNVAPLDTACENSTYRILDATYQDANSISWSSSGNGTFDQSHTGNPAYSFSNSDKEQDSIHFFVEVSSLAPCIEVDYDTLTVRLYHEPTSSFTYDNQEGCSPLSVNFTNTSSGEDLSYRWDFGNGRESFDLNPDTITFLQGILGDTTYTVTLEAANRCGSAVLTHNVIAKPIPNANFGMDVAWGCSPKEINFFNVTTGLPDSYTWEWGDGKDNSHEEQPESHIFETEDIEANYQITLIAENQCGVDSIQKNVTIFPNNVTAFFETDTTFGCAPFEVSFTNYSRGVLGDEPFLNWSWNFGDGTVTRSKLNPVHTFESPGKYVITLYVNDTCSFDSFTTEVVALESPHIDFESDKTTYCQFDTVYLKPVDLLTDGIGNVTWDFDDTTQSYNFNEKHVYNTAGEYNISLSAKDIVNGCVSKATHKVNILKAPEAAFSSDQQNGCQPLSVKFTNETQEAEYYSWDFGNGNSSIEVDGQQLYTGQGKYTITLKATNSSGCSHTVQHLLDVYPKPLASFESSLTQTCFPPVRVDFTNLTEGAEGYSWDFGNGFYSKETNPSATFNNHGEYPVSLIATNMYLCSDTSTQTFNAYHNPSAEFTTDTVVGCDPFTVSFQNLTQHGSEYYWSFENQGHSVDENPEHTFEGEGTYNVSLIAVGSGGCADTLVKEGYITTNPSPLANFEYTRINQIDTVQFHNYSSGGISYLWNFGDGNASNETEPWHRYANYGTYQVSLTATNQYNCKNTFNDTINFKLFKGLFLPSAISPDNISEDVREFKAIGIGLIKYHLVVFDAWGNLIWETSKLEKGVPAEGWDGKLNGKPLPPDVYVWHLKEAIFKDGSSYKGKRYGTVTIIK